MLTLLSAVDTCIDLLSVQCAGRPDELSLLAPYVIELCDLDVFCLAADGAFSASDTFLSAGRLFGDALIYPCMLEFRYLNDVGLIADSAFTNLLAGFAACSFFEH